MWLMWIAAPRPGLTPALVNMNVFATRAANGVWQLRNTLESDRAYEGLFMSSTGRLKSLRKIFEDAQEPVTDPTAHGTGKLIRALYDACGFN
jgi:hypothetical protein